MNHWCIPILCLVTYLTVLSCLPGSDLQSGFSQTHKIGNIPIIANFVHVCTVSFSIYSMQYEIGHQ